MLKLNGLFLSLLLMSCAPEKNLDDLIDEKKFEELFPNHDAFYSYSAFREAAQSFPMFVGEGSNKKRKTELAAFLANVAHETTGGWDDAPGGPEAWGLFYLEELDCENGCPAYCDTASGVACAAGKSYHGRGPIQLSHNYNYNSAGEYLGLNLLAAPELVITDPVVSFQTAIWFWMEGLAGNATTPHQAIIDGDGFGETIRIINSGECNGGASRAVDDRVRFFEHFSNKLGGKTGDNIDC